MSHIEVLLLAGALAVDAFSIGATVGLKHNEARQVFRLSFHFGLFQSLLLGAGIAGGSFLVVYMEALDHWIAFAILLGLGARMIYNSSRDHEPGRDIDLTRGANLVGLSIAVGIDALGAGVGLPAANAPIIFSLAVTGLVASLATMTAMLIANRITSRIGTRCELIAGLVLIGLGVKILFDHLA